MEISIGNVSLESHFYGVIVLESECILYLISKFYLVCDISNVEHLIGIVTAGSPASPISAVQNKVQFVFPLSERRQSFNADIRLCHKTQNTKIPHTFWSTQTIIINSMLACPTMLYSIQLRSEIH